MERKSRREGEAKSSGMHWKARMEQERGERKGREDEEKGGVEREISGGIWKTNNYACVVNTHVTRIEFPLSLPSKIKIND